MKAPLPNDDRGIIDDRRLVARQFVQVAVGVMNLVHTRGDEPQFGQVGVDDGRK
jgi:hypothetical protein